MENKEVLFTLSKNNGDFIVQPFKGSGKGGQKRNKTMSCCRIVHPESGAVSECQEERSFEQNKQKAFIRLAEKPKFKAWYKMEYARRLGKFDGIEEKVDSLMRPENLLIEEFIDGKWVKM